MKMNIINFYFMNTKCKKNLSENLLLLRSKVILSKYCDRTWHQIIYHFVNMKDNCQILELFNSINHF